MKRTWTQEQYGLLRDKYPNTPMAELCAIFPDKTATAIKSRANILGIKKAKKRFHFSDKQVKFLKEKYANTLNTDLAKMLGCTVSAINNKAYSLGLKKDKQFIAGISRKLMENPNHPGRRHWIKKGNISFNKGKKQSQYMSPEAIEKTKATRFKKGHLPHNTRPAGYERMDKDGYLYIKVEGKRKMVLKHRYIWEQHKGAVPEGCNIQFRDGNRRNCHIENLYLISRSEQISENTIHRYPPEIKTAIRRIGKLNKLIKHENKY